MNKMSLFVRTKGKMAEVHCNHKTDSEAISKARAPSYKCVDSGAQSCVYSLFYRIYFPYDRDKSSQFCTLYLIFLKVCLAVCMWRARGRELASFQTYSPAKNALCFTVSLWMAASLSR